MRPTSRAPNLSRREHTMAKATSSKRETKVLRKRSTGTKRRKLNRRRSYDEEKYPEDRLPFYKFSGQQVDYWAPTRSKSDGTLEGVLGQEAMGAFFALLTVRAMSKKRNGGPPHSVLTDIVGEIVRKGRFWGEHPDWIAVSFVATIADLLVLADGAGLVNEFALNTASKYAESLNEASVPAGARSALAKNITLRRLFASAAEEYGDNAWEELTKVSGPTRLG